MLLPVPALNFLGRHWPCNVPLGEIPSQAAAGRSALPPVAMLRLGLATLGPLERGPPAWALPQPRVREWTAPSAQADISLALSSLQIPLRGVLHRPEIG